MHARLFGCVPRGGTARHGTATRYARDGTAPHRTAPLHTTNQPPRVHLSRSAGVQTYERALAAPLPNRAIAQRVLCYPGGGARTERPRTKYVLAQSTMFHARTNVRTRSARANNKKNAPKWAHLSQHYSFRFNHTERMMIAQCARNSTLPRRQYRFHLHRQREQGHRPRCRPNSARRAGV